MLDLNHSRNSPRARAEAAVAKRYLRLERTEMRNLRTGHCMSRENHLIIVKMGRLGTRLFALTTQGYLTSVGQEAAENVLPW